MSEINSVKPAETMLSVKKMTSSVNTAVSAEKNSTATNSSAVASTDKVSLSGDLEKLSHQVKKQPEVNEYHVAFLKNAVESGTYNVDAQKLAQKMLNFEGSL